jgi:hypothetical protein
MDTTVFYYLMTLSIDATLVKKTDVFQVSVDLLANKSLSVDKCDHHVCNGGVFMENSFENSGEAQGGDSL